MSDSCADCKFYLADAHDATRPGACRRYPPKPVDFVHGKWQARFIQVDPGDWCGEHEEAGA